MRRDIRKLFKNVRNVLFHDYDTYCLSENISKLIRISLRPENKNCRRIHYNSFFSLKETELWDRWVAVHIGKIMPHIVHVAILHLLIYVLFRLLVKPYSLVLLLYNEKSELSMDSNYSIIIFCSKFTFHLFPCQYQIIFF